VGGAAPQERLEKSVLKTFSSRQQNTAPWNRGGALRFFGCGKKIYRESLPLPKTFHWVNSCLFQAAVQFFRKLVLRQGQAFGDLGLKNPRPDFHPELAAGCLALLPAFRQAISLDPLRAKMDHWAK
jgi:hypothetical protein